MSLLVEQAGSATPGERFGVDERFRYVRSGMKRLRRGYTTGTCAALAAQAAVRALLLGEDPSEASLVTPAGIAVRVPIEETVRGESSVRCTVRKDGGDDDDATDGMAICVRVSLRSDGGMAVDGGKGVGVVTKPGLDQPVGAAAINHVPRSMIIDQLREVAVEAGYEGGLAATVIVPEGERIGAHTFNPQLGIEGGISILGTSGIVEPRSLEALRASIEVEIRQATVLGAGRVVITPGNYGSDFVEKRPLLSEIPRAQCANFIGDALVFAARAGARQVLMVGHIGKLVKVAAGVMNTHSKVADCRRETMCAHAALAGADRACAQRLMKSATTDACLEILERVGLKKAVASSLAEEVQRHLDLRAPDGLQVGAIAFDGQREELFRTVGAVRLLEDWGISDER